MATPPAAEMAVQRSRDLLIDLDFRARHRTHDKAFTRERKLSFHVVMLMLLQKTLKSLQLHLHEFFASLTGDASAAATPGAWTQARTKLKHTAFIELNEVAVLDVIYGPGTLPPATLWQGHRLLAIDGSNVRMPHHRALFEHFGGQEPSNQSGSCEIRVPYARLSLLYDLCNYIGIDAQVGTFWQGEVGMAVSHLSKVRPGDVIVCDRGYAGYLFLAQIAMSGAHFVVRCQQQSFAEAKKLFARNEHGASVTVILPARSRLVEARAAGLPIEMKVRFVSVRLPTGELEVLVTSLVDEKACPAGEFLELYHRRWGIETYFKILKSHLDLENFTGLTVEAVLQDIHAAVFLANLQSLVSSQAAAQLTQNSRAQHRHQPNKAVGFHALKCRMIDLLASTTPVEEVLAELTTLFLANPVSIRPNRNPSRHPPLPLRSLNFLRRSRKTVF